MKPYLTVPFSFSSESFSWIKEFFNPIVTNYEKTAPRAAGLLNLSDEHQKQLYESAAWKEILSFSLKHNLKNPYPQVFIYKKQPTKRSVILGNPHIDTAGEGGIAKTVYARFNILLDGFDSTEMVWWDIDRNDQRIINYQFQRPDHSYIGRLQAAGNSIKEQWDLVGEPIYKANNLAKIQEYASFVRTDILHALNWTGEDPRLVFSIKFDVYSWDEIEKLRSLY